MKRLAVAVCLGVFGLVGVAFADPPACDTSQPRSCAAWSSYYFSSQYCGVVICYDVDPAGEREYLPITVEESFRICSYSDGTQCKETQTKNVYACGSVCPTSLPLK